jgi:hypothetical protein
MKVVAVDKFRQWYEGERERYRVEGLSYDFKEEMSKYCKSDVLLLKHGVIRFRRLMEKLTGENPFEIATTAASACNHIYRKHFMPPKAIGIIPKDGYRSVDLQSPIALTWMQGIEQSRGIHLRRSGNVAGLGEMRIEGYKTDGYHKDQATGVEEVFEFLGCYYHGCSDCYKDQTVKNHRLQKSMGELNGHVKSRLAHFLSKGYKCIYMWECVFNKELEASPRLQAIHEANAKLFPLNPRDAFFGGRTEPFRNHWVAPADGSETIKYLDFTSLYPAVNARSEYPVGHPKVLISSPGSAPIPVDKVTSTWGLVKCLVLPPPSLLLPVLPLRMHGKLIFPLCKKCAQLAGEEKEGDVKRDFCDHPPRERAFWGTFCTPELLLALDHGYEVLEVMEIWHWERRSNELFAGYVKAFLKSKTEASGWPVECVGNPELQAKFIAEFQAREGVVLDSANMEKNEGIRFISKLLLNSFWGYFGMRDNLSKIEYVSSYSRIIEMVSSDTLSIESMAMVGEDMLLVQYKENEEFVLESMKTSPIIASFTTAHARCLLYRAMASVPDPQRVLYCDTDSIIFIHNKSETLPPTLTTGNFLGDLTDELPTNVEVSEYYSAGPKFYLLQGKNVVTGEDYVVFKIKGVSLNSSTEAVINPDSIKRLVLGSINALYAPFSNIRRFKETGKLINSSCLKKCRVTNSKRLFYGDGTSYPFGFIDL